MSVRRIVTGVVEGLSTVIADGEAPVIRSTEIWMTTPEERLGSEPDERVRPLDPPPGSTVWRMVTLPPDDQVRAALAANPVPGIDAEGLHATRAVDYVFVLDGPVDLVLEATTVTVNPGDCVVQRETVHAWRNHNDFAIRLLTVKVSTTG